MRCLFPVNIERKVYMKQADRWMTVPCGKCASCRTRRVQSWAFRLTKEARCWPSLHFVTFTYSDMNLPVVGGSDGLEYPTLDKRDMQLYIKRLRKSSGAKLKYYICGEYGGRTHRPHYHAIFFGDEKLTEDAIVNSWCDQGTGDMKGIVHFGQVESASIKYVVGYLNKGVSIPEGDPRWPEFALMSKGLGQSVIDDSMVKYVEDSTVRDFFFSKEQGLRPPVIINAVFSRFPFHGN